MMLMTDSLGRESAHLLVSDALAQSRETGKTFREALLACPKPRARFPPTNCNDRRARELPGSR